MAAAPPHPKFCTECRMWLQPYQWEDHRRGKKHRKNVLHKNVRTVVSHKLGGYDNLRLELLMWLLTEKQMSEHLRRVSQEDR